MLDLIVIGAGLTGLIAAYRAAKEGLKVKIIAKGLGALHWSAGTIDVLGCYPDEHAMVEYLQENLQALIETQPHHPYALLGEARVTGALQDFWALSEKLDLPYAGSPRSGENLRLPSPIGALRPTCLAPQAQLAGDLINRPEPMLVVGFRGMRDFFPELIAENLGKQGHRARAVFVPLELITDRRDSNTAQLANGLDDPARRSKLAVELKKLVQPGERIGLPAILGMAEHAAVMKEAQATTDAAVFEIPTLPPSVPGIRLNNALRRQVEQMGVRVEVNMEVNGFHAEDGHIAWVETETSARPLKHRADKFLLATGGILGGGINTDHTGRAWEVVFNLPLTMPQKRGEWFRQRFFDSTGHPIFRSGVPVNWQLQPVDASGSPVYANLWAAGNILAHADPIRERSLEGIAIATGTVAAQHIVRQTSNDKRDPDV